MKNNEQFTKISFSTLGGISKRTQCSSNSAPNEVNGHYILDLSGNRIMQILSIVENLASTTLSQPD